MPVSVIQLVQSKLVSPVQDVRKIPRAKLQYQQQGCWHLRKATNPSLYTICQFQMPKVNLPNASVESDPVAVRSVAKVKPVEQHAFVRTTTAAEVVGALAIPEKFAEPIQPGKHFALIH